MLCNFPRQRHPRLLQSLVMGLVSWLVVLPGGDWAAAQTVHSEAPTPGVQSGHNLLMVDAVAFSPKGNWLASAGGEGAAGTIKVWGLDKQLVVHSLSAHTSMVLALAFSSDNNRLASADARGGIRVWDMQSGKVIRSWSQDPGAVLCVLFSPDGRWLASGGADGVVRLWDLNGNSLAHSFPKAAGHITCLAVSPNSRWLASGGADGAVRIWDLSRRELHRTCTGHRWHVRSIYFSPDSDKLASASLDSTVMLWAVDTGRKQRILPCAQAPKLVMFRNEGRELLTGGNNGDLDTNLYLTRIDLQEASKSPAVRIPLRLSEFYFALSGSWPVAFDATGERVAVGSDFGTVKIYRVQDGRELASFGSETVETTCLVLSPDNRWLAVGCNDGTVRLWNLLTGEQRPILRYHSKSVEGVHFSPDSRLLISQNAEGAAVWEVALERARIYHRHPMGWLYYADGTWLAVGNDREIYPFEAATGNRLPKLSLRHDMGINRLARSPDGKWVASWSHLGNEIKVWTLQPVRLAHTVHNSDGSFSTAAMQFSPDSRYLGWCGDRGEVRALNLGSWETTTLGNGGVTGTRRTVAFSSDGRLMAACLGKAVAVWELSTGKRVADLAGHQGSPSAVGFHKDSSLLLTGALDGVRVWNWKSSQELAALVSFRDKGAWLAYTPEGFFDGTRRAWDRLPWQFPSKPTKLYEPEQFFGLFFQPLIVADVVREGRPMLEVLKNRGDSRAVLDVHTYRNSRLPVVSFVKPTGLASATERQTDVEVEVVADGSGAQDCRIFRNQSLVYFRPGSLAGGANSGRELLRAKATLVAGRNELSAYCFNRDGLRSKEARVVVAGAPSLGREGTAYVLAIGVNHYSNPSFDLNYAAKDAHTVTCGLRSSLKSTGELGKIVSVEILDQEATREKIQCVLRALAGDKLGPGDELPRDCPPLQRVGPEDVVVVFFAGHGLAEKGQYFLLPHNLGSRTDREKLQRNDVADLCRHALSDKDFERAFARLDTGKCVFVIDACESGQALDAEEKRRGPLNSRGLAQLAYEKGMYVLAAAQSYQAAREPSILENGLLTYALFRDGLEADQVRGPAGELTVLRWLEYAAERVPTLDVVVRTGQVRPAGDSQLTLVGRRNNIWVPQQPRLFYRREVEDLPFLIGKRKRD
jgi:WD40 repeat protein